MFLSELAIKNKDKEWLTNINNIANKSKLELIEDEIKNEIIPNLKSISIPMLKYCLPHVIYAMNYSDKFSEEFLQNIIIKMNQRYNFLNDLEITRNNKEEK